MLDIRCCCENCNLDLPADSTQARVCSFECTFCVNCVENILKNICPNCGGGFQPRPVRPAINLKNNNCLEQYPAATKRLFRPVDLDAHRQLVAKVLAQS